MAVNQDILKLFTGISDERLDPLTPMTADQRIMQSGLRGQELMRSGMRGMLTGDRRSGQQKQTDNQAKVLANFEKLSVENQKALIGKLQAQGQTALAGQLVAQAQKSAQKQANDSRRMSMISQAREFRLRPDCYFVGQTAVV